MKIIATLTMLAPLYCLASVDDVIDQAAQTIWATNEIVETKVPPNTVTKLVDITFPCKIIYQTNTGDVRVLKPISSSDDEECKKINRYDPARQNEKAVKKWGTYALYASLCMSLIVNVILFSMKSERPKQTR